MYSPCEAAHLLLPPIGPPVTPPVVLVGGLSPSMTVQGKDGVGTGNGKPVPKHRQRRREARSRIFRELVHIAAEQGASISLGVSTADALQECLDRAVALLRFATDQVDQLTADVPDDVLSSLPVQDDPLFEVIKNPQGPDLIQPHRYILMEKEARMEVEKLAAMMTQLGIAERVVRVREAEAALLVAAVRDAAVDAGLTHDQVRALGEALRRRTEAGMQSKAPMPRGPDRDAVHEIPEVSRSLEDAYPEASP